MLVLGLGGEGGYPSHWGGPSSGISLHYIYYVCVMLCFKAFVHLPLTIDHTNQETRRLCSRQKLSQQLARQAGRRQAGRTGALPSRNFRVKDLVLIEVRTLMACSSGEPAGRQARAPGRNFRDRDLILIEVRLL